MKETKFLKIEDMLNEIKRITNKYFKRCEIKLAGKQAEDKYWVDVFTEDLPLPLDTLDSFSAEMAGQFNIERSKFVVWAPKEDKMGIGFFLPYHRVLAQAEVEAKFVIVEAEFRDYFPPPGVKFSVLGDSPSKVYEVSLDEHSRIFLTKWFNDHSGIKPNDTTIIWTLEPLETYVLTLRK
jgi:hypothetical protein